MLLVTKIVASEYKRGHISYVICEPNSVPYCFGGRYFLHNWPKLCWLAFDGAACFGVVVCKVDDHRGVLRGYIAMLVVKHEYRKHGVGEATAANFFHNFQFKDTSAMPHDP